MYSAKIYLHHDKSLKGKWWNNFDISNMNKKLHDINLTPCFNFLSKESSVGGMFVNVIILDSWITFYTLRNFGAHKHKKHERLIVIFLCDKVLFVQHSWSPFYSWMISPLVDWVNYCIIAWLFKCNLYNWEKVNYFFFNAVTINLQLLCYQNTMNIL